MSNTDMILLAGMVLLTVCCCGFAVLFMQKRTQEKHIEATILKGCAGLCFLCIGILAMLQNKSPFTLLLVCGLACGLIGDELLALRKIRPARHDLFFISGAVAFAVGHLFYMAALAGSQKHLLLYSVPVFALWMGLSGIYAHKREFRTGKMKILNTLYIGIVSCVSALAVTAAYLRPDAGSVLLALAGILFLISDNILSAFTFGNIKTRTMDIVLHVTYYAAQILIAWSIFLI